MSSVISVTKEVALRSTVRNVILRNCRTTGCGIDCAIIENVCIDGLKTHQLLQIWAAVFRHVVIKGGVGRVMISPAVASGTATKEEQKLFDEANREFYKHVDWALDIKEMSCDEFQVQGIPASLIRRDPETQVIVTRESAMKGEWRSLDLSGTWWPVSLQQLLDRGDRDSVLVAPKRNRAFRKLLNGLDLLRQAGVAT